MQNKSERLQHAMVVYENVRMVLEQLRDIDMELDSRDFEGLAATVRAKEHLELAHQELDALAALMQAMHMRPSQDSSSGVLDEDRS